MFTVYVIQSDKGKFYIGQTANLEIRLNRHNKILPNKKNSYTSRNGNNWKIVYKEDFLTRGGSLKREKELKSHKGRDFIKSKINGGVCRTV